MRCEGYCCSPFRRALPALQAPRASATRVAINSTAARAAQLWTARGTRLTRTSKHIGSMPDMAKDGTPTAGGDQARGKRAEEQTKVAPGPSREGSPTPGHPLMPQGPEAG